MTISKNNIPEAKEAIRRATDAALHAAGMTVHNQAVELVPVITGNLKGSLSWTVAGEVHGLNSPGGKAPTGPPRAATPEEGIQPSFSGDFAHIGTNVVYAAAVEFGYGTRPPKSYLRTALDVEAPRIPDVMAKTYRDALNRVVK